MDSVLILGARSDIAMALAHRFAKEGHSLVLAARNAKTLEGDCANLNLRYQIEAKAVEFDAREVQTHPHFVQSLTPLPAITILVVGYLGEQEKGQKDFAETQKILETNFVGCASILNEIANAYESNKRGTIIGISSVAGDRGRKSNYLYGAAKAGFTAYLSGLRNRLYSVGVHVMTVKPGFVQTSMTEGMDLPEKLTASPENVAQDIFQAYKKKKNELYTGWFWKWIMLIVRHIPEGIFKKLNL